MNDETRKAYITLDCPPALESIERVVKAAVELLFTHYCYGDMKESESVRVNMNGKALVEFRPEPIEAEHRECSTEACLCNYPQYDGDVSPAMISKVAMADHGAGLGRPDRIGEEKLEYITGHTLQEIADDSVAATGEEGPDLRALLEKLMGSGA